MKRIISWLLAIALLLTLAMPVAMAADERTSGAFTYRIKGNGTIAITSFDWAQNNGDIYVPNMLDGYTISEIGAEAFARNSYSENEAKDKVLITLPNTITIIGDKAFFNTAITSIIIPASIEEIGVGAFANCKNITRFSVATGNSTYTTIDDALYNKKTKTLIAYPMTKELAAIPNGIVAIGDYAFYGKEFLGSGYGVYIAQYLPASIKTIGNWAFAYTSMNISKYDEGGFLPPKVEKIGDYAFYACDIYSLGSPFDTPETLQIIGNHAFENMRFKRNDFTVGGLRISGALKIGDYAFSNANVELEWFPYGDKKDKTMVELGEYAFCYNPYTFYFDEAKIASLAEGAFKGVSVYNKTESQPSWPSDITIYHLVIPGKYEAVPDEAFRTGGSQLSVPKIILSDGITKVGAYAFADRKDLEEIELPATLTTIEEGAFSNCPSLEEATLPASITQIGESAFDRETISLTVEAGSYAERWARDNGYAYGYADSDDLNWLNN